MMAYYEAGTYDCVILDHGFDVSKEKKTPFIWVSFMPAKRDGEAVDAEYERVVKMYLTDKTIESVVSRLRGLGWEGTSFKDLESGGHSFKGVNTKLRCMHEQNGSSVYENWEFPAPGGGVTVEKKKGMTKKLDALFGKALKATAKPKAQAEAPEEVSVSEADDDCPF